MTTTVGESEHGQLYRDVREAIASLPQYFRTETHISGIVATDLHTLNTVLGATIEEQVVRTLNQTRNTWDPDGLYALYSFVRQAQTFPDVLLRRSSDGEVLLGIELKGWYLLAKEREPSLRFQVTEAACADQDLIVVVPWALNNVISGSPVVFDPSWNPARLQPATAITIGSMYGRPTWARAFGFRKASRPILASPSRFSTGRSLTAAVTSDA